MLNHFRTHITLQFPLLLEAKILIANSSGLDSMVLTDLCLKSDLNIALAYCNFQLRGDENLNEESFLSNVAETNQLQLFKKRFNTKTFAQSSKQSTQMAARQLRYEWFETLAKKHQFDFILTAHHADDNLETFLINLSRATGIDGMLGIPKQNHKIIRPLLPFSRQDIFSYANKNKLQWCEDSSNESLTYQRNKLRHNVVPQLKAIFPQILDQLSVTQAHLFSAQKLITKHLKIVENLACEAQNNGEFHYNINTLESFGPPEDYVFPLLKQFGFTDWVALQNLISSQSGKQILSQTHKVVKNRDILIVAPLEKFRSLEYQISKTESETHLPQLNKIVRIIPAEHPNKNQRSDIFVDTKTLEFPLSLRSWRAGDYFFPEGMTGKKKLSKFFKDEKLSLTDKSRTLVLCSGDKIIWVVGMRADRRFLTTKDTVSVSKISFLNATN